MLNRIGDIKLPCSIPLFTFINCLFVAILNLALEYINFIVPIISLGIPNANP